MCALGENGERLREVHFSSSSPSSSCVQCIIKTCRYSSSSRTSNLNFPRLRLRLLTILLSNPPPPHQPSRQQLLNHTRIHTSAKIHIPRRRRRRKKKTMMMMIFWKRSKRRRHTYTPSSSSSSNTFIPYSSSSSSICNGFSILGLNRRWNRFFLSSFFFLKRSLFEGLLLLLLFPSAAVIRGTALVDRQLSCRWRCRNFLLHGSSFDDYWRWR